ncbi:MAG: IS6 family transposase [Chlamydiia bacterium]|nr:IS6 family transposase [Chlamydiia bacterium]
MASLDSNDNPFKWKHFADEIILWAVRWYCQFALTYRDLVMMMQERGLSASHTTIMRWVHQYAKEFKKRLKKFLKLSNDSYRVDETYIKIKGVWHYLYRAVDSDGNTLDWMLSATRDQEAAKRFFRQTLSNDHCVAPRVVGVDKNAAYPPAFKAIKEEGLVSTDTELRQVKYLNNVIEQDHRFSKRRIRHSQWLQTFRAAEATISGYESMHMIRKGQVEGIGRKDALAQKMFIDRLFGIAA